jgi:hypothetical protein
MNGRQRIWAVVTMVLAIVATGLFSACQKDEGTQPPQYDTSMAESRTVMVYMAAENSMSDYVSSDMREMLDGMASKVFYPGDRIVVYVDDNTLPRIYLIDNTTNVTSPANLQPVKTYSEDVNSASAEQLGAFVSYVKTNDKYKADSYVLVMWSHGTGWIPSDYSGDVSSQSLRRSFGVDNGYNYTSGNKIDEGYKMNIPDMARALEEQGGVDVILFDACFMQTVEVAYELRHAAAHIISSPAEIPGLGADYSTMVPAMFQKDDYATKMLEAYYNRYCNDPACGIVISSVNTDALDSFAAYVKQVVALHRDDLLNADYTHVLDYLLYGVGRWGTDNPDCYDMQGVMKNVMSEEEFAVWQEKVSQVITCMHTNFWYSGRRGGWKTYQIEDPSQCCGVSMFIPLNKYATNSARFNDTYLDMEWGKDVWGIEN